MIGHCPFSLVGLVVKVFTLRAADMGFDSGFFSRGIFQFESVNDLKIGVSVAVLPGAWHYRVSAWTGWLSVNVL